MLIKILHFGRIVCGEHVDQNEVVDAPEPDALRLVGMGAAERYTEPAEVPAPPALATNDPDEK